MITSVDIRTRAGWPDVEAAVLRPWDNSSRLAERRCLCTSSQAVKDPFRKQPLSCSSSLSRNKARKVKSSGFCRAGAACELGSAISVCTRLLKQEPEGFR